MITKRLTPLFYFYTVIAFFIIMTSVVLFFVWYSVESSRVNPVSETRYPSKQQTDAIIRNLIRLQHAKTPVRFQDVLAALQHPSHQVRFQAMKTISSAFPPEALDYLGDRVMNDPVPLIRKTALELINRHFRYSAQKYNLLAITDRSVSVQDAALEYLLQDSDLNLAGLIIKSAADRAPTSGQIKALSRLGGHDAVEYLIGVVEDYPKQSVLAGSALVDIGADAVDAISSVLLTQNLQIGTREIFASILSRIDTPKSKILLLDLSRHPEWIFRASVCPALIQLNSPDALSRIRDLILSDSSPQVRKAACDALAGVNSESGFEMLRECRQRSDAETIRYIDGLLRKADQL